MTSSTEILTTDQGLPLLLTARQAAALCSISLRTWRTWDAAGRIPAPMRMGHSTRWRTAELRAWIAAGCPSREEWQARAEANN
jgi:excisionase family DNA binding protein